MSMWLSDYSRSYYQAERRVERWRRLGTPIDMFGTIWDIEHEVVFDHGPAAQRYLDSAAKACGLPPVKFQTGRGVQKAYYRNPGHIFMPKSWEATNTRPSEITAYVLLHELAHHATHVAGTRRHDTDMHGEAFQAALCDVLHATDNPITAQLLSIVIHEEMAIPV